MVLAHFTSILDTDPFIVLSHDPISDHRVSDFYEARNVGSAHVVHAAGHLAMLDALRVNSAHDIPKPLLKLFSSPRDSNTVLTHLKPRYSHAASISSFTWRE